jgi:hypothetical protein
VHDAAVVVIATVVVAAAVVVVVAAMVRCTKASKVIAKYSVVL